MSLGLITSVSPLPLHLLTRPLPLVLLLQPWVLLIMPSPWAPLVVVVVDINMTIVLTGFAKVVEAKNLPILEVVGHSIMPPLLVDRVPLL